MLSLAADVRTSLVTHAREGAPEEVCGVIGGETGPDGDDARGTTSKRVPNVSPTPGSRYELDPEVQLAVMEGLEDAGHDVVGFYHSHPQGPDRPSATDEGQAAWSGYRYVIVSLAGAEPTVGSWVWAGERFREEPVRVSDGS